MSREDVIRLLTQAFEQAAERLRVEGYHDP